MRRLRRKRKHAKRQRAMKAVPPTTLPTMGPTLGDSFFECPVESFKGSVDVEPGITSGTCEEVDDEEVDD